MFGLIRRLFRPRQKGPDLTLWPSPLRTGDIERLMHHVAKVSGAVMPAKYWDMAELLVAAREANGRDALAKLEPQMLPDDLEAFGLDRHLQISADAFLCLTPDAQRDPEAAMWRIWQFTIPAVGNRRLLNETVELGGPKAAVELWVCDETGCAQARSFKGKTWASVAPDFPLPGCNAAKCLCLYRPVIEF